MFQNAPRRFGGRRINLPMRRSSMPAPAGTGGSMPAQQGPITSWGGSNGGINFSGSGYGAPPAMRAGGTFDHRFTDGTPGQPKIPAGVSTAMNPSGMQQAAPMAFEDGGAVDEDDTSGIPEDEGSASDVDQDEGAAPTGQSALENADVSQDSNTRNINAALAKVDAAFQQGRQRFGLTDNFRRSDNIEDSRSEQMGVADMLKSQQQAAQASRAARQNFENAGQDSARLPINRLWDQPVLAIPGTLQDQAGLNDVGEQYSRGGPVKRYDDGGAIEDDSQPQDDQQDLSGFQNPMGDPTVGDVPRLAAYVQGEGAAAPDAVQQYLSGYNHLPKEQATVQALADAVEPSYDVGIGGFAGPQPNGMDSTSLLQGYRQHYDHGRAYAVAAANGNAQKPANLQDSVKAANDAFPYVPDGERVHFTVGPNNTVNVSIGGPNGEQRANTALTIDQYKAFLMRSDFDNVYERTPSLMLQDIMSSDVSGITTGPTRQQAQPQGGEFMAGSAGIQPSAGADQSQTPQTGQPPARPTPDNHPGYNMYTNARGTYFVPQDIDARSQALTGGWLSRENERQQFINEQMQQGVKNEIDMMKARNPLGVQQLRNEGALARTQYASSLKAAWEDRRTQAQIMINLDKIAAQHQNEQARNAANLARAQLLGGVDPADVPDNVRKMTGVEMSRLLNLEGRTPQAPNASNSPNPPPLPYGGKNTQVRAPQAPQTVFKDGKLWYKTQRGTWSDQPQ